MKLLPALLMSFGLLASPVLLADEDKHDKHDHKSETAEEHAKHADEDHDHEDGSAKEHAEHEHEGHDHKDHASHHGGIVAMVDEIHHELVIAEDGKVSLYAEGMPVGDGLKKFKVRLIVLRGTDKHDTEMTLAKDDHHRFEAGEGFKLEAGDKVVVVIKAAEVKPRMVRFEITSSTTKGQ